MTWQINLPIRDSDEIIDVKTTAELPDHLDGDDAAICRELFIFAQQTAYPQATTVGDLAEAVEDFNSDERKGLLEVLRYRAGLCSIREAKQHEAYEQAQHDVKHRIVYDEEPRWGYAPNGAVVDLNEVERERSSSAQRGTITSSPSQPSASKNRRSQHLRLVSRNAPRPSSFAARLHSVSRCHDLER